MSNAKGILHCRILKVIAKEKSSLFDKQHRTPSSWLNGSFKLSLESVVRRTNWELGIRPLYFDQTCPTTGCSGLCISIKPSIVSTPLPLNSLWVFPFMSRIRAINSDHSSLETSVAIIVKIWYFGVIITAIVGNIFQCYACLILEQLIRYL